MDSTSEFKDYYAAFYLKKAERPFLYKISEATYRKLPALLVRSNTARVDSDHIFVFFQTVDGKCVLVSLEDIDYMDVTMKSLDKDSQVSEYEEPEDEIRFFFRGRVKPMIAKLEKRECKEAAYLVKMLREGFYDHESIVILYEDHPERITVNCSNLLLVEMSRRQLKQSDLLLSESAVNFHLSESDKKL